MKKRLLFFAIILLPILSSAQNDALRLASDIWPPFTDNEQNTAVAIDLVTRALNRTGIKIENEISDFEDVIVNIKERRVDGSAALWKSPEREEYLLFSDPYLYNQLVLVGKKGSDVSMKSIDDLKGKRIGIVGNYAYGSSIEESMEIDWLNGDSDQGNLRLLLDGKVDYILVDALLIQYLLNQRKDEALQHLEIGENTIIKRSLHFAIRKDMPDAEAIIENFNREILLMAADGNYNKILHLNWIKADIDGDGTVELVLEGKRGGELPPESAYSVITPNQNSAIPGEKPRYYVGGNFYDNWNSIPQEYKVAQMKNEDLSKIGLVSFRF